MDIQMNSSPVIAWRWKVFLQIDPVSKDRFGAFLGAVSQPHEIKDGVFSRKQPTAYSFQLLQIDGPPVGSIHTSQKNEWTETHPCGWGPLCFVTRNAAFHSNSSVQKANSFIVRCTISYPPYSSSPTTTTELSYRHSLSSAAVASFEDESSSDVFFSFEVNGVRLSRRVLVQQLILKERSSYFRTMFTSGFEKSSTSPGKSSSVATSTSSPWDNDDDSLEWLPSSWLDKHGPTKEVDSDVSGAISVDSDTEAGSESDETESEAEQPQTLTNGRIEVKVSDTGYTTYRAILYFLYSNEIAFTPPASDFVIHLIKSEAPLTRDVDGDTPPPIMPAKIVSRRDFLLEKSLTRSIGAKKVEAASPHAVYQLADKLDLEEFKKLAKEAILKGFKVENILYELVSTFSYHHVEIQTAGLDFALKNWDAVKTTSAFTRVVHGSGEIEGAATIWEKLLCRLKADGVE